MPEKDTVYIEKEVNALLDAFFLLLEYTESKRVKQFDLYTYNNLKGFIHGTPILETEYFGSTIKKRMQRFIKEDEAGNLKKK